MPQARQVLRQLVGSIDWLDIRDDLVTFYQVWALPAGAGFIIWGAIPAVQVVPIVIGAVLVLGWFALMGYLTRND